MRPSRHRGAFKNNGCKIPIAIFVIGFRHVHRVGAGSVFIQLKTSFARGARRKKLNSYTTSTFGNQADARGNLDFGVDDARLCAFPVEEESEVAGGTCASEGEVEKEKM